MLPSPQIPTQKRVVGDQMAHSRWPLVVLILVLLAALKPVLDLGFVLHDDGLEILDNPHFFPLTGPSMRRIWSTSDFSRIYSPIGYSALGGLTAFSRWWHNLGPVDPPTPGVFHAASLILHIANSCLVYGCLLKVAKCRASGADTGWVSLLTTLMFALHPTQVEGYARAGNVTVILGAFWSLLAVIFFIRSLSQQRGSTSFGVLAFLFFVFGLLTKPAVVALPIAAFATGWASRKTNFRSLSLRLLPWVFASAAYTFLSLNLQPPVFDSSAVGGRWWERPAIAADSLTWYASQTLWPTSMSIDHGRTPQAVMTSPTVWLSLAGLSACLVGLFLCARKWRWEAAGGFVFVALLIPVSGLVPAANREALSIVYDRHLYLPLVGVALIITAMLGKVRPDFILVAGVPLVGLVITFSRSQIIYWHDSIALFDHVLKVNPSSWYGSGQLGTALMLAGRPVEAVQFLSRSAELNPAIVETRINLGQALLDAGRPEDAEIVLRQTILVAPEQANAHNNLTVALLRLNAWAEAEIEARQVLQLKPGHPMAMMNLALAMAGDGRLEDALLQMRQTLTAYPNLAVGWRSLSEILLESGRMHESNEALERACHFAPGRSDWRTLLAGRLAEQQEVEPKLVK